MSASADISQFLKSLGAVSDATHLAALRALDLAGEHVLGDAQEICPVSPSEKGTPGYREGSQPGFLKASATALPAERHGVKITKTIGFNADYAMYVHENLEAFHPQGQAKFLETAINKNREKIREYIIKAINEAK